MKSVAVVLFTLLLSQSIGLAQDDFDSFESKPESVKRSKRQATNKVEIKSNEKFQDFDPNFQARESNKYDTPETSVFGRETKVGAKKKQKKYVNLNPETAFGPEVIEGFDHKDTDILTLTKKMQELTGLNLILDKNAKGGKVSISAPSAITVGDAWKAYLTVLSMNGLALVKEGKFYRIINARDIRYTPTKIYTGDFVPNIENYMMKIISLKHVEANEIVRNFRPFMSRYGRILDIKQTNTIIVTDTGTNINRLLKLVRFLDVPGHQETMHILKVANTSAQELAKLLESIIKQESGSGRSRSRRSSTKEAKTGPVISKIIAEPRTNSIIAMANAQGAKHLKKLVGKLDVSEVAQRSEKIHVYYVQHGAAENLSTTINALISNSSSSSSRSSSRTSRSRSLRRSTNNNNQSKNIFGEEVKVTADKDTNTLVVTASQTDWITLKSVLKKLDIPRMQVYVEGLIVETNVNVTNQFGTGYVGAYGGAGFPTAGFNAGGVLGLASGDTATLAKTLGGAAIASFGLGNKVTLNLGGNDVQVSSLNGVLQALKENGDTNVLATPQLLVMDNSEGTFEVGEEVPIQTGLQSNTGGAVASAEVQQVTMKIKIKPQINKATRFITLEIDQAIKDVSSRVNAATGGVGTNVRNATTTVIVRDQDTIAMGGLLRDKETDVEKKIPLLGDLPVLGWLFKSKTKNRLKTNLLMFLTPKILSPYDNIAAQNTLDVLKKRNKSVRDGKNKKDPYEKQMNEVANRIKKQIDGPLYTKKQAELYDNVNSELEVAKEDFEDVPDAEVIEEMKSLTIDEINKANINDQSDIDFIESDL